MKNYNFIEVKGYVGEDVKVVENEGKIPYASYYIKVPFKQDKEGKKSYLLYDIVSFGTDAYVAAEYFKKDSFVLLKGVLQSNIKQDGTPRKNMKIVISSGGQYIIPKPSKYWNKNLDKSLVGDIITDDGDIVPVDDGEMSF